MKNGINLLLAVALVCSGLLLVQSSHQARQLFSALDRAQREHKQLEAEYRRLDAERQTQSRQDKVERVARQRLHMQAPALTVYVDTPVDLGKARPPAATEPTTLAQVR